MKLFGTSGIRAVFDKDLVNLAFKVGMALGRSYTDVVVGTDTRTSGDVMKHAVMSGLLAAGAGCRDAGIAPTPTIALATREFAAGVMITASHNPPEYNGIKLLNPDGSSFDSVQQGLMEEAIMVEMLETAPWEAVKRSHIYEGAIEHHVESLLPYFPGGLKLRVVVDAGCGAAAEVTPRLLKGLGCEVIELNCYPSGFFPRGIEPTEANLEGLKQAVRESGASLGIAHDGDADRMMAVDDRGDFIPGDKLLAIFARAVEAGEVVTTLDASMAIEEMGFRVRRTRIGDTWVSEELRNGGDFGGEASGSWVFPDISLCPDGIYAAARLVAIASRQKLSELVDGIFAYPLLRGSVSSDGMALSSLEAALMAMEPSSVSRIDGIKLDFKDGWLLVRPSGTEPKIRLTAEAKNEARARQLYDGGLVAISNTAGIKGRID
ncbi:phosphoglucosamine mutase [Chloroflexota bacterium]